MGIVRIAGSIDLQLFWPGTSSDADTTKIRVAVPREGFEFSANGRTSFTKIPKLGTAFVVGETGRQDVLKFHKRVNTTTLMVRTLGVDAPEHYRPRIPIKGLPDAVRARFSALNAEFRQGGAESATVAVAKHLSTIDPAVVDYRRTRKNFSSRLDSGRGTVRYQQDSGSRTRDFRRGAQSGASLDPRRR